MTLLPIRPVEPRMRIRGFFASWSWVDMVAFSLSSGSVLPTPTLISTGAHRSVAGATMPSRVGAWHATKPMVKSSCEMGVVAKAAGVGDLDQRLTRSQRRPALQKARSVIQTKRVYELTAGRAALRKELL